MSASSHTRVLLLGLAALALTVGGFFLGRRLPAPEATPRPSASPAILEKGQIAGKVAVTPPPRQPPGTAAMRSAPAEADDAPDGPRADPPGVSARRPARRGPRPAPSAAGASLAPDPGELDRPLAAPRVAGRHRFVAGLTQIGTTRASGAELRGFDPTAVALKRAPESDGAIEFEVAPVQVQPGLPYMVKVYLRNRGTKSIRVKSLSVASEMNGRRSRGSLSPRSKAVEPSLVGLLAELPGVWKDDVTSWSIEVDVLTTDGDSYSSRVAWK